MDMTLEAFAALEPGSYVLLDIRNAQSREYGCFPGSLAMPREALEDCTLPHDGRKLIVYCARGQFSREAAEMLAKQGYEAFSLEGGYSAWLKGQMQRQQENLQEKAETSLQKKVSSAVVVPVYQSHSPVCAGTGRGQDRRVHFGRQGFHAHGQTLSAAAASQQIPL